MQLDYFIMNIKEDELKSKWEDVKPINLKNKATPQNNNQIIILQHPDSKTLQISFSYCRIVGEYN